MKGQEGIFFRSGDAFTFLGLHKGWYFSTKNDWRQFNKEALWTTSGYEDWTTQTLKVPLEYLT